MPIPWKNIPADNAFAALDAEWAVLCRRHRRSAVVARWARRETDLAGVRVEEHDPADLVCPC